MVGVYTCGLAVPMIDRNSFLRASSSLSFSTRSGRETGWSGRAARCSFSTRRGAPFYIDGANPTQPLVSSPCYLSSALTLEVKACARMLDGIKGRAVVMPQMYPGGRLPGVHSSSCERRQMRLSGTATACCCERKCVRARASLCACVRACVLVRTHPCSLLHACLNGCASVRLCARAWVQVCQRVSVSALRLHAPGLIALHSDTCTMQFTSIVGSIPTAAMACGNPSELQYDTTTRGVPAYSRRCYSC